MDFNRAHSLFLSIKHAEEQKGPTMDETLVNTRNYISTEYKAGAKYIREAKETMQKVVNECQMVLKNNNAQFVQERTEMHKNFLAGSENASKEGYKKFETVIRAHQAIVEKVVALRQGINELLAPPQDQ